MAIKADGKTIYNFVNLLKRYPDLQNKVDGLFGGGNVGSDIHIENNNNSLVNFNIKIIPPGNAQGSDYYFGSFKIENGKLFKEVPSVTWEEWER